jgi:predicted HicB family RNase H-like nuclease
MTSAKRVLKQARDLARSVKSWADLSNALFDPVNGLVTTAYPTREARESFMKTTEYQKIRQLLRDTMDAFGVIEGAIPKSGRFVVRLPRSLHAALEREADREGVSLNQLVVAKLSAQLSSLV